MAVLTKVVNAQYPIVVCFTANAADSMVNTSGTSKTFGDATPGAFDIFTPPPGAIVIGGVVKVETIAAGSTSTVDVGDSDDTDRYTETGAIDLADADAPASGFEQLGDHKVYNGSQAIRITMANGGALSALKFHVIVTMIIPGRARENLKTT
jgi:hypothetical protein